MKYLKYLIIAVCVLIMNQCAPSVSVNIPSSQIPDHAWRPGDEAIVKRPLVYKAMSYSAYIRPPSKMFNADTAGKPVSPYKQISMIEKGTRIEIVRVTKEITPNSHGGIETTALIIDGELAGKEAMIKSTNMINGYVVRDSAYYELTTKMNPRANQ